MDFVKRTEMSSEAKDCLSSWDGLGFTESHSEGRGPGTGYDADVSRGRGG